MHRIIVTFGMAVGLLSCGMAPAQTALCQYQQPQHWSCNA